MALPRPSSFRALAADLKAFLAARDRHHIVAMLLALLVPGLIFTAFFLQDRHYKPPVKVIYVQSWKADRTDAQIIADQKKAQAEQETRAKERQRQFKKLADQLGIE